MKLMIDDGLTDLIGLIHGELVPGQVLYIVGGAVRDLLLNRDLHDLDFVMAENPTDLAKSVARRLEVGFFVLDDVRHTARVVYKDPKGKQLHLDFVQFTGDSLDEDLNNRDFTINAMAIGLNDLTQVIDPLGGREDLEKRLLRACSDHALADDPVRVLRGARLAVQFNLQFVPGLEAAMQSAAERLPKTSYERQRDEFFRLLAGPNPAKGLWFCRCFRVFETLLPSLVDLENISNEPMHENDLVDQSIHAVAYYHQLLGLLSNDGYHSKEIDWRLTAIKKELGQFLTAIDYFFSSVVTPGRTKAELAFFGTLLHKIGQTHQAKTDLDELNQATVGGDLAWQEAKRLQLSNAESAWVKTLVRYQMDLRLLVAADELPNRRQVYRFYRKTGEVGVAIALQILAVALTSNDENLSPERWKRKLAIVSVLVSAWFEKHDKVVKPVPLLNGHDLQQYYGLKPGKLIGTLLSQLVEEQASGTISRNEEAHNFVQEKLCKLSKKGGE